MTYFVEGLTNVPGRENDVRHIGETEKLEDAIKSSQHVIDKFLITNYHYGMTVADLFSIYKSAGEVPVIFSDDDKTINVGAFNHFKYAILKCTEICT